jgi:hypothetical protein
MRLASYYRYPLRGQGKKRKTTALATTVVLKGKNVKVLTHRPWYIEPVILPEFGEEASSTAEARRAAPVVQSVEEPIVVPKMPTVGPVEAKDDKAEEPKVEETMKMSEILSPPSEAKLPKVQKAPAATPKRRRMASVLDAVLETTKALSPTPTSKIVEAAKVQAEAEAGPSAPTRRRLSRLRTRLISKLQGKVWQKKQNPLPPKLQSKMLITFFDMLRGKII